MTQTAKTRPQSELIPIIPHKITEEITEDDTRLFFEVIRTDLSVEQKARILSPEKQYPDQTSVMAVHWHPAEVEARAKKAKRNSLWNCLGIIRR